MHSGGPRIDPGQGEERCGCVSMWRSGGVGGVAVGQKATDPECLAKGKQGEVLKVIPDGNKQLWTPAVCLLADMSKHK